MYFEKYVKTEKDKTFDESDLLETYANDKEKYAVIEKYINEVKKAYVLKVDSLN